MFREKWYRVKFNRKDIMQKKSKISKHIWMKPCSKTRSNKSTCANIFLELPLTILFRYYLEMNATSCYWSYVNFYTLITYNYILTDTYNSDTAAGPEFISSPLSWGVLKNFANFTGKHLCWRLFFTKLQAFRSATFLKEILSGVFL